MLEPGVRGVDALTRGGCSFSRVAANLAASIGQTNRPGRFVIFSLGSEGYVCYADRAYDFVHHHEANYQRDVVYVDHD